MISGNSDDTCRVSRPTCVICSSMRAMRPVERTSLMRSVMLPGRLTLRLTETMRVSRYPPAKYSSLSNRTRWPGFNASCRRSTTV